MARLIEQSEQMVYINCLRLLKDPEEARDMAQEVFLTVFVKLDTLKKPEAFFEWVKIITVNKCRNKLKKSNPYFLLEDMNGPAQSLYEEKDEGDPYARFEDRRDQISPDKYLDKKEVQDLVIRLIDDLPDAQRMVLILFYYDDYSIREIARIMEISEGTVKSRLAYGRLALKKSLEKEKKKGNILYGRTPVSLLAYIAHFLKKSFSDHQDEISAMKGTASAAAGASASSTGTAAASAAAHAASTGTAGSSLISAVDTLAVESANAFISGGLSLKGLSLTALWATAWGKAVVTTVAGAVLIGSVAGGTSLAAKARGPEPVPVEVQGTIQEARESSAEENSVLEEESVLEEPTQENSIQEESAQEESSQQERAQTVPENTAENSTNQTTEYIETVTAETEAPSEEAETATVMTEQSEAYEGIVETTESTEPAATAESTPEVTETSVEPEEQSSAMEESSVSVNEEQIAELEENLEWEKNNLINIQGNYDNAIQGYESALAFAEENLSEGRKICERERDFWKEEYENQVAFNEQEGSDYFSEEEIAYSFSWYQKWQGLYDIVIPATVEDAKNQIFPEEFENINVAGKNLVEKEEELALWQTLWDEQEARVNEAQAALDAAKQ